MDGPKYSRLEADISAMQRSSSTYCDQPEDGPDFGAWLKVCTVKFNLETRCNMESHLVGEVSWRKAPVGRVS